VLGAETMEQKIGGRAKLSALEDHYWFYLERAFFDMLGGKEACQKQMNNKFKTSCGVRKQANEKKKVVERTQ